VRARELVTDDDDDRQAILAAFRRALARVSAADELDELARSYEQLLEHTRKQTGTYYTPAELVDCLLDHCLEPALDHAVAQADPAAALLALKICDPACGSGRFLVAAARRVADRLVALDGRDRTEEIAAVVEHCIYGVDVDPIAIELCRLSLRIEAGGRARHDRLRCGDALLGAPAEHAPSWAAADAWCVAALSPQTDCGTDCDAERALALVEGYRFFHWSLAFPELHNFDDKFDVVVGNPPWEMLEQDDDANQQQRAGAQRLIAASGRFPLGAAARKNLYVLFAELGDALCGAEGRLGMVLPTEIVQGAIADRLARRWFEAGRVAAVFDFQNRPRGARPAISRLAAVPRARGRGRGAVLRRRLDRRHPRSRPGLSAGRGGAAAAVPRELSLADVSWTSRSTGPRAGLRARKAAR
jgi:predicted RNA methylase